NARVSLSWGGWQARWDAPPTGAGRSLFRHFADVLRAADFQSFQAMANDTNTADIRAMVRTLGAYGPVMLAHYKPDNGPGAVFEPPLRALLTDRYLADRDPPRPVRHELHGRRQPDRIGRAARVR